MICHRSGSAFQALSVDIKVTNHSTLKVCICNALERSGCMCNRLERGCAVSPKTTIIIVQTSCSNHNNTARQRLQLFLALNLKGHRN